MSQNETFNEQKAEEETSSVVSHDDLKDLYARSSRTRDDHADEVTVDDEHPEATSFDKHVTPTPWDEAYSVLLLVRQALPELKRLAPMTFIHVTHEVKSIFEQTHKKTPLLNTRTSKNLPGQLDLFPVHPTAESEGS